MHFINIHTYLLFLFVKWLHQHAPASFGTSEQFPNLSSILWCWSGPPNMDCSWMEPLMNGWCSIEDEDQCAVWSYFQRGTLRTDEWLVMRKDSEIQHPEFTVCGDVGFFRRTKCLQENWFNLFDLLLFLVVYWEYTVVLHIFLVAGRVVFHQEPSSSIWLSRPVLHEERLHSSSELCSLLWPQDPAVQFGLHSIHCWQVHLDSYQLLRQSTIPHFVSCYTNLGELAVAKGGAAWWPDCIAYKPSPSCTMARAWQFGWWRGEWCEDSIEGRGTWIKITRTTKRWIQQNHQDHEIKQNHVDRDIMIAALALLGIADVLSFHCKSNAALEAWNLMTFV